MKRILKEDELLNVDDNTSSGRMYNIKDIGQVPSVTSVLERGFPISYGLLRWFKMNTEEECEKIGGKARARGTRIHETAQRLIETGTFNTKVLNPLERIDVKGLIAWKKDMKPVFLHTECAIAYIEDGIRTAGRVDLICQIGKEKWLVDFKTSSRLHKNNEPQVALYAKATGCTRAALLHLNSTKKGYTFKEVDIEEGFKAFQAAHTLFVYTMSNKEKEKNHEETKAS